MRTSKKKKLAVQHSSTDGEAAANVTHVPRTFGLRRLRLVCRRLVPLLAAAVVHVRPRGALPVLALLGGLCLRLLLELLLHLVFLGCLDAVALALLECRLISRHKRTTVVVQDRERTSKRVSDRELRGKRKIVDNEAGRRMRNEQAIGCFEEAGGRTHRARKNVPWVNDTLYTA